MKVKTPSSPGLSRAVRALAATALMLAGLALAALAAPHASADLGVPTVPVTVSPPPVSQPLPPVTLPALPGSSNTTSTPADPSPAGASPGMSSAPAPTLSGEAARNELAVEGAIRLANGGISIPVASVTSPARLVVESVRIAPARVSRRNQPFDAAVRVTDSRGYAARGALVELRSLPAGYTRVVSVERTRVDGAALVRFRTTALLPLRRGGKLTLLVRVYQPDQQAWAATTLFGIRVDPAR